MLRKTILHNDSMQIEENSDRKTIHKSIDMQTEMMQSNQQLCKTIMFNDSSHNINYRNQQENESHLFEIDRRRTYTKEESVKWHNITDKEMMYNMIDDESNPCLDSLDNQEMLQRVSSEHSAMVIYEHAVEDFVNLTIVESPLNNTFSQSRMSQSNIQRRQSRIPSPVNNLISMFDNLTRSLKKKDSPKPRLEIDDYLEKMKIGQVKIPRYPQNNAKYMTDCVEKKFQKYKEHCDKISKASNSYSVKIFPEIPSAS
ncbi:hypothetical protein PVAND_011378 [Polypedilum vanderplanki]|uniref:Uncharacterized protein n=1 Tax=Polypedilum vanderplanki TaxID=319348 RepID=A0A9J6CJV1_POLVA|nr:hypothetical protein PVAND_011378 [Polypedilum vanderplanki]